MKLTVSFDVTPEEHRLLKLAGMDTLPALAPLVRSSILLRARSQLRAIIDMSDQSRNGKREPKSEPKRNGKAVHLARINRQRNMVQTMVRNGKLTPVQGIDKMQALLAEANKFGGK